MNPTIEISFKTAQAYNAMCKPLCQELKLPQTAFDILMFLANNPDCTTARDIVEIRKIKANLVSVNVDRLVQEGYLERRAVAGDRRKTQLLCTEKAQPVIARGRAVQERFFARLLQNTDAAAGMTKELAQEGEITERDKVIFAAYQTSGSAIITNYFSSGVAVFAFLGTSVIVPLAVILVFKFVGANILRVWLNFEERRNPTQGAQA